ncbi:hypothetical protein ESA94_03405 [Lacibacter luteus]|uniref:Uncharacterized protein n=1 Tax=Lacibacter luteus TaxID=2508719 RepID=A0A4Q1CMZ8_9BACT|nr:hypothetical protein [Lacibacter luteus]RXK62071.1 hypothetical protein ESA94_03405 [Lacibacter luteus]
MTDLQMKIQQIIKLSYYNPELKIAFSQWRELYLLKGANDFELLSTEVYQGQLVYRSKGSHKRISWTSIKKGLLKKEVLLYLPF